MYFGVDYYPEQWDASMLEDDLRNIVELGSNTIRIGEFAWHRMEKSEGTYDFSFFDNVIAKAKAAGLYVIFGTPTATLPAWLAKAHPEVLSEFDNGRKRSFGGRRNYCFNSPKYNEYSQKIVTALVTHYKDEDAIIAWQLDNEFGHEDSDICYCDCCKTAFQQYLAKLYNNDIDKLNDTYGTAFWSQEYNTFDEIPLPLPTITTHNPSLRMDWERFRSKSVVDYAKMQYDLIKMIIPNATVMHDFSGGGMGKHFDLSDVAQNLDVVAYNNYPVWGGQKEPIKPHEIAFNLCYMRGLKQQHFWITEGIMGAQGHDVTGFSPRPNQAKMWSYQGIAHGCNSMMFFRYRGAIKGAEQFCYGVLDADNVKRRKFHEVQSFFIHMKAFDDVINAPINNDVCFIYDYDSMASFRIQRQSILLDYEAELKKLYKPLHDKNIHADVLSSKEDFAKYKLVIIPIMIVWTKEFQDRVKAYAEQGGTVIFTYRTAVKDIHNNLTLNLLLPNNYTDLIGGYVVETESLQEHDCIPLLGKGEWGGREGKAGVFRDFCIPTEAEVLYSYNDDFYLEYAAVTKNTYGNGTVYYFGTSMTDETLQQAMSYVVDNAGITSIESPEGVEVVPRLVGEGEYQFIINHNAKSVILNGEELAPFETIIKKVR